MRRFVWLGLRQKLRCPRSAHGFQFLLPAGDRLCYRVANAMTLGGFIVRNALRNKRRFALTLFSVAVSLFLLTVLQVVLRGMTDPATTDEAALRVVVRHKVSLANMLFAKYKLRLEKMPGVKAVTKLLWFGGIYRDEKNFFPQFACDAGSLFDVLVEARIDPKQREHFVRQRTACVVGVKTMERFGWKVGDRITLLGAMWPCDLELEIAGVYSGGMDETHLYFHHEYFDELLGDQGITGLFWVRAESAAAAAQLLGQIDATFDALTLRRFNASTLQRFNVPRSLSFVFPPSSD